ncbi:flavodoxin [Cellulomonas sp. zg-ZUI222]|uniref:Flavodoxin n=1 Tax=Cellulomonas wangleii TaxID=2816956 RepID=A0ABX8D5J7_9CELL|nr:MULTISPECIES: flavodoxin domain-containing protein [Cellulomonas]MBO0900080.1 flavodoxin [Cellulomonas sp. zg-ZUI22]MBO0921005.1 flavodoxin [Cellulomonas wangleii]MBO0925513.1 flavodoxin [Cellulomonas wangleii]QVI61017.1 flavodoxin [Cellulomonas wangleii]
MRVLVTVASRHGATREMGAEVAEQLRAAGHEVDEVEPDDVEHVDPYDAVVLGSAVYVGRLALGLRDLVDRQAGQLRERPVWLFWSGPVGDPPVPETVPDDVTEIARTVGARGVAVFTGRLDRAGLNISERALVALTRADAGDFRDLDAVRAWAQDVARELRQIARSA